MKPLLLNEELSSLQNSLRIVIKWLRKKEKRDPLACRRTSINFTDSIYLTVTLLPLSDGYHSSGFCLLLCVSSSISFQQSLSLPLSVVTMSAICTRKWWSELSGPLWSSLSQFGTHSKELFIAWKSISVTRFYTSLEKAFCIVEYCVGWRSCFQDCSNALHQQESISCLLTEIDFTHPTNYQSKSIVLFPLTSENRWSFITVASGAAVYDLHWDRESWS